METVILILAFGMMVGGLGFVWSKNYRARLAYAKGCEAWKAKDWDEAESAFRKAVRLQPIAAVVRRMLAVTLASRGNAKEAEEQFRMATSLEPRNGHGYADLALFLVSLGPERWDDAAGALEQALKHAPELRETLAHIDILTPLRTDERFRRLLEPPA